MPKHSAVSSVTQRLDLAQRQGTPAQRENSPAMCGLLASEDHRPARSAGHDTIRQRTTPPTSGPTTPTRTPVPFPQELALKLSAAVKQYVGETVVTDEVGRRFSPWDLQDAFRTARKEVNGLPEGFRFHDLRHYFASLLISSGADVKVVQKRLRHASAMTTLNTYGHLWPDADESARAAVAVVMAARADSLAKRFAD